MRQNVLWHSDCTTHPNDHLKYYLFYYYTIHFGGIICKKEGECNKENYNSTKINNLKQNFRF